jgi:hypothetical protein
MTAKLSHLPLVQMLNERSMPIPFSGCIVWLASTTEAGYGVFTRNRKFVYAHSFGPGFESLIRHQIKRVSTCCLTLFS